MQELTTGDEIVVVPPPRRQGKGRTLGIHAVQLITRLGLLPLAASIIALALFSRPRLPAGTHRRGHPVIYPDASVVVIALIGRLWNLSSREVCGPTHMTDCPRIL
jgi:hypothetical protein